MMKNLVCLESNRHTISYNTHLSMYPSPSPSHAWNSFRTRSSSQMEPVSLSTSAVCDIFLLTSGARARPSQRTVPAVVVSSLPRRCRGALYASFARPLVECQLRERDTGRRSLRAPCPRAFFYAALRLIPVYLAVAGDACRRTRDEESSGVIASPGDDNDDDDARPPRVSRDSRK